jgi:hypothetical protein
LTVSIDRSTAQLGAAIQATDTTLMIRSSDTYPGTGAGLHGRGFRRRSATNAVCSGTSGHGIGRNDINLPQPSHDHRSIPTAFRTATTSDKSRGN